MCWYVGYYYCIKKTISSIFWNIKDSLKYNENSFWAFTIFKLKKKERKKKQKEL